ncbi:hypothetical protein [Salinicola aestuarinus]|uniref:hypothetical protein n=1 Tax=Salinicola aestuarinus TaxID=1949082 RepID=UPI000DA16DF6|nr:hypothetical protein [Salinicola aestuarinus]
MSDANEAQTPPSYEALLNNLRRDREYAELPGAEIAMWPEDVAFYDDLSNHERFNERFLEPKKNQPHEAAYILYFFIGVFGNFGLLFFFNDITRSPIEWGDLIFDLFMFFSMPVIFFPSSIGRRAEAGSYLIDKPNWSMWVSVMGWQKLMLGVTSNPS